MPRYDFNIFIYSYEFNYDLVVSLESAVMTFSLEVDGKTMGSVNVDYK